MLDRELVALPPAGLPGTQRRYLYGSIDRDRDILLFHAIEPFGRHAIDLETGRLFTSD